MRHSSGPELTYPLLAWTRPLTRAERDADFRSDLVPPKFSVYPRDDPEFHRRSGWFAQLPADVPSCPVCGLPRRAGLLCSGCKKLLAQHGRPLKTLELLTIVNRRDPPETLIWDWKEQTTHADGTYCHPAELLGSIAPRLSAYVRAHAKRLLADEPVLTWVPSRAPLLLAAFDLSGRHDPPAVELVESGSKLGTWLQHESEGQAERLSRTPDDWQIRTDIVAGRRVVLFDDVFVSGASMFSYAAALKRAGATEVCGVAIGRHVSDYYRDYDDALRVARRTHGRTYQWSPDRQNLCRLAPPQDDMAGRLIAARRR